MSDVAADAARLVREWVPRNDVDRTMLASFARFFVEGGGPGGWSPMWRTGGPDHATSSCVVFDPDLTHTLLVFHKKGGFWVQPGGHLETGDRSIVGAGLRELREETGVDLEPSAVVAHDLDHHSLGAGFGSCASHLDFGTAVIADPATELAVSDESEDVRWWDLGALPREVPDGLPRRLGAMVARARDGWGP